MSEQNTADPLVGHRQGLRTHRLVARLLAASLIALLVVAAIVTGWYRASFHTWPWSADLPDRVAYCERDYLGPGRPVTRAEAESSEHGALREVGRNGVGGLGKRIYAHPLSEQDRDRYNPPLPCALVIFLRTADDRYAPYTLSGGP